jgi:hypothetical protein
MDEYDEPQASHGMTGGRAVKLVGLSVVFLFMVVTLMSLLIPSHIRISKAINIGHSQTAILNLVKDTTQWRRWHPAFMPSDSAQPFPAISIQAQKSGSDEVVMRLQQGSKRYVMNGWKLHPASADSTALQWYMDFNLSWYPWQKFGSLFYESTYGAMMERGLANLKAIEQ